MRQLELTFKVASEAGYLLQNNATPPKERSEAGRVLALWRFFNERF